MDVVRAALGENQINYLGFSYGTELGAAYAEAHPDRVRAMVLDGAVDPSLDPIEESLRLLETDYVDLLQWAPILRSSSPGITS